jgi:hypothetical protein
MLSAVVKQVGDLDSDWQVDRRVLGLFKVLVPKGIEDF